MTTSSITRLDHAHAAMMGAPESDAARLRFYECFIDAQVFVLLDEHTRSDTATPTVFETGDGSFVLSFDLEERLSAFTERPVGYAAMSGRELITLVRQKDIGIALNPGPFPSSHLIPATAVNWLETILDRIPEFSQKRIVGIHPMSDSDQPLIEAIALKLRGLQGRAAEAILFVASYEDGSQGAILAFVETLEEAGADIDRAISDMAAFRPDLRQPLDTTHLSSENRLLGQMRSVGLRFDLTLQEIRPKTPPVPGSDPDKPPLLR